MGENSEISWTHHTWNPWWGCEKVSPACRACYAEAFDRRVGGSHWGKDAPRRFFGDAHWAKPRQWDAKARKAGERHRVFCASMADVFEDRPDLVAPRVRLFHLISETPNLDWLLLTKRPANIRRFYGGDGVPRSWSESMPPNVWLGVTAESQKYADERIPHLLKVPAAVRFLSCEPLLGPVDLTRLDNGGGETFDALTAKVTTHRGHSFVASDVKPIDWVISGGESTSKARPSNPDWFRQLRDQCKAAGIPYHHKQNGEWLADGQGIPFLMDVAGGRGAHKVRRIDFQGHDITDDELTSRIPCVVVRKVGTKAAGRLLDGVLHDEFPTPEVATP